MQPLTPPQNRLEQSPPLLRPRLGGCPVWNGRGVKPVGFWLLEKRIHWYGVHFIDDRARPCLRSVGRCRPCEEAWLPRQTGYVCAMQGATGGRYLLRISAYAYRHCPALALVGADYRGTPVLMQRLADRKNAPWKIAIPVVRETPQLPPPVDVEHVLSLLWGMDLKRVAESPPPDGDLEPELRPYAPRKERGR